MGNPTGKHYLSMVAARTVDVVKEQKTLTALGAITAYATSFSTVVSFIGICFSFKASVPLHFTYGKVAYSYRRHIVYGPNDGFEDEGSGSSDSRGAPEYDCQDSGHAQMGLMASPGLAARFPF